MKRVTWPSRQKVESTTLVVIASVFAFAIYFKVVDTIIDKTVVAGYNYLVK
jgi:preprotein translocase subunit SecE